MNCIIDINEASFFKRYNISLKKIWNNTDDETKDNLLQAISMNIKNWDNDSVSFDNINILRIVLGYGGRAFLERVMVNGLPTLKAIIWEPDPLIFSAYCTLEDISDYILDERLVLCLGNDLDNLENIFRENIQDNNAYHYKAIAFGKYTSPNNEYIKNLVRILEQVMGDATQGGYERKSFNIMPCNNLLYTIKSLNDNYVISQLFDAIPSRDIPVIIVSAGPSLMNNCNELMRAKNRAIIVAVTHSLRTLNRFGIEPDLVAVTDASGTDFLNNDINRNNTILSSVYADYKCREKYNGHIIYHGFTMVNHLFSNDRTATEQYAELDTGSVATDVFSLFVSAGFKTVILCGQDLAYGENGNTHTEGENENSSYEQNNLYSETDGIFGNKVKTRGDWERFRKYFEKKIDEHKEIDVIDATEGGALIHGTTIMKLSEAIGKYCTSSYPISDWIDSMQKGDKEEKNHIKQWFGDSKNDLARMEEYIDQAISLNRSIRSLWSHPEKWNDQFNADCKRYDIMYSQILEGSRGDLLRLYCVEDVQKYVETALIYEGDDNAEQRMIMEYELFCVMKERSVELKAFIDRLVCF